MVAAQPPSPSCPLPHARTMPATSSTQDPAPKTQHPRPSTHDLAPTIQHPRSNTHDPQPIPRPTQHAGDTTEARSKAIKVPGFQTLCVPSMNTHVRFWDGVSGVKDRLPRRGMMLGVCVGKAGLSASTMGGGGKGYRSRARRRVSGLPTCPYIVMTSLWGNEKWTI